MKNVVVIGAGPAGLTACYTMLKESKDYHVTVIEASDFIGGISRTANYKNNRIDIGGHRFFSKDDEIMNLWKEIMPVEGKPALDDIITGRERKFPDGETADPQKDDNVFLVRHRVSRIYYKKKFFDYPVSLKMSTIINMGFVSTVKAGFGYLWSVIHKLPETSLENFYINRFGRPLYEMFFEDYTEKLWGIHPSKISADWGAQRVKGLSIMKVITNALAKPFKKKDKNVETSLIEEFYYPKYGPGQLWERLAEIDKNMGADIIMKTEVINVKAENGVIKGVTVKNTENSKETFIPCDYLISSMPVKDLVSAFDNPPKNVKEIADGLPYRDFITVGVLVDKLELKNKTKFQTVNNIVPDTWIYVQERDVKVGRLQIFNNWSPYMVDDVKKHIWIGMEYFCTEGDKMWNMPADDFKKRAVNELCKIGVVKKSHVLDTCHIRVKKAYPAYFGTYKDFDKVKNYLDSYPNLFCVGRNGQHRYNNMDHSMMTGILAARQIINGKTDKTPVWNVNTEKEYHEEKKGNAK